MQKKERVPAMCIPTNFNHQRLPEMNDDPTPTKPVPIGNRIPSDPSKYRLCQQSRLQCNRRSICRQLCLLQGLLPISISSMITSNTAKRNCFVELNSNVLQLSIHILRLELKWLYWFQLESLGNHSMFTSPPEILYRLST